MAVLYWQKTKNGCLRLRWEKINCSWASGYFKVPKILVLIVIVVTWYVHLTNVFLIYKWVYFVSCKVYLIKLGFNKLNDDDGSSSFSYRFWKDNYWQAYHSDQILLFLLLLLLLILVDNENCPLQSLWLLVLSILFDLPVSIWFIFIFLGDNDDDGDDGDIER